MKGLGRKGEEMAEELKKQRNILTTASSNTIGNKAKAFTLTNSIPYKTEISSSKTNESVNISNVKTPKTNHRNSAKQRKDSQKSIPTKQSKSYSRNTNGKIHLSINLYFQIRISTKSDSFVLVIRKYIQETFSTMSFMEMACILGTQERFIGGSGNMGRLMVLGSFFGRIISAIKENM